MAMTNTPGAKAPKNPGKGVVKAFQGKGVKSGKAFGLPGKSVSSKAAGPMQPKQPEKRVPMGSLASDQRHTVGGIKGHLSYKT